MRTVIHSDGFETKSDRSWQRAFMPSEAPLAWLKWTWRPPG